MSKKAIAASLVTVWLALFGVEFLGVSGLIGPGRPDIAVAVEAALASLTRVELSDDKFSAESDSLLITSGLPTIEPIALGYFPKTTKFVTRTPPIYKLHVAFLL